MSYGEFTGNAPLRTCAFWPVPPTARAARDLGAGLPPILVVSTTNDPATPYQAGVDLAKQLGGSLLTFEGTQHTVVFQGNPCVDDIAAKYLVDVTVPPPAPGADARHDRCLVTSLTVTVLIACWYPGSDSGRSRANMFAMWRGQADGCAARAVAGVGPDVPVAAAIPGGQTTPSVRAAAGVGQTAQPSSATSAPSPPPSAPWCPYPSTTRNPRGTSAIGGHPGARHRRPDRRADGQPRRSRARRPSTPSPGWARHWPTPTHPALRPGRLRPARRRPFDPAGALPHRRGVRRLPPRADGRLQPGRRRAHRADLPAGRAGLRRPDGRGLPGQRRHRVDRAATWTWCGRRWGRTRSTISASPTAPSSAPRTPNGIPTGCARWCSTAPSTQSGSGRREHPPDGGFPNGFRRLRRRLRAVAGCPLGTDPTQFVARYHQLVDPLVQQPGRTSDPRGLSYQDAITGTVNALYTPALLEVPDQRAARACSAAPTPATCCCWPTTTRAATTTGTTRTAGCVHRDPLRRLARTRPIPRCGPRPIGRPARRRRSCPTANSPDSRRATSAPCGRCRRRRRRTRDFAGARQGRRRVDDPRPGDAVSGRAWIWRGRWTPR